MAASGRMMSMGGMGSVHHAGRAGRTDASVLCHLEVHQNERDLWLHLSRNLSGHHQSPHGAGAAVGTVHTGLVHFCTIGVAQDVVRCMQYVEAQAVETQLRRTHKTI